MWQFMPFRSVCLERNGWFDERFDPDKSSLAYARYMKELYNQSAIGPSLWRTTGPGMLSAPIEMRPVWRFLELYTTKLCPPRPRIMSRHLSRGHHGQKPEQYG